MAGMAPKCSNHVSQKGNGAGKWMFIPLKMVFVLIGIDPYPYGFSQFPNSLYGDSH
jgi:hypothetical protein